MCMREDEGEKAIKVGGAEGGEEPQGKEKDKREKRTLAAYKALLLERRDQHRLIRGAERTLEGQRTSGEFIGAQIGLVFEATFFVGV